MCTNTFQYLNQHFCESLNVSPYFFLGKASNTDCKRENEKNSIVCFNSANICLSKLDYSC
jgi:hypothetical protein